MSLVPSTEIPLRSIMHVVCKWHTLIIGTFFLIVTVVTAYTLWITPLYEATAQILVKVGRENLYTPTTLTKDAAEPRFYSENQEAQTNSEVEILKSRILAKNVINTLGLDKIYPLLANSSKNVDKNVSFTSDTAVSKSPSTLDTAVAIFQSNLRIEGIKKTNVIQLTFLHMDREMASKALDTLLAQYMDLHLRIHRNAQSVQFFKDQTRTQLDDLQAAQNALSEFKREHGITSSPTELLNQLLIEESALRSALNQTLSEEAETEGRVNKLRTQIEGIPKTVTLDQEESDNGQTISNLQTKLTDLEAKNTDLLSRYTDDNLLVQNNIKDILEIKAKIAQQEGKKYSRVHSGLNNLYQHSMQELLANEANYQALKAKRQAQSQQLLSYQQMINNLDESELEYNRLKQKVDIAKKGYNTLLVQHDESKMSQAMDMERITNLNILDPAHSSLMPVKPKKALNIVLGIFLGGISSFAIAFILQYFNKTLETPEDVETHLGLKVLSSVPDISESIKQPVKQGASMEPAYMNWLWKLWQ